MGSWPQNRWYTATSMLALKQKDVKIYGRWEIGLKRVGWLAQKIVRLKPHHQALSNALDIVASNILFVDLLHVATLTFHVITCGMALHLSSCG